MESKAQWLMREAKAARMMKPPLRNLTPLRNLPSVTKPSQGGGPGGPSTAPPHERRPAAGLPSAAGGRRRRQWSDRLTKNLPGGNGTFDSIDQHLADARPRMCIMLRMGCYGQ